MNARQIIDPFLHSIGRQAGADLCLDESGCCCVEFGDGDECVITASPDSDVVTLQTPLLPVLVSDERKLFSRLLAWNMNGQETCGCTLGLDPATNVIVLGFRTSAERLDEPRFASLLARFMETGSGLCERIAEFETARGGPQPPHDPLSHAFIRV